MQLYFLYILPSCVVAWYVGWSPDPDPGRGHQGGQVRLQRGGHRGRHHAHCYSSNKDATSGTVISMALLLFLQHRGV